MKRICIVGWYGTETLGDIAILDGIFKVLSEIYKEYTVYLGSLYPFYTEHTISQQLPIFKLNSKANFEVKIFNIKDKFSTDYHLNQSDCLLFGGGPLMDLEELVLMNYCFEYAKRRGIPSIIMGCGLGPVNKDKYIQILRNMIENCTAVSWRDEQSYELSKKLNMRCKYELVAGDPAIVSAVEYQQSSAYSGKKEGQLVINFREHPAAEYGNATFSVERAIEIVSRLRLGYEQVLLVPMHTFAIGGDDRRFLADIKLAIGDCVSYIDRPQNLHDLYRTYQSATACVGMRYHSIVLQSILNGNNYMIDYTSGGKTRGFLKFFDTTGFYENRICDISNINEEEILEVLQEKKRFNGEISNPKDMYASWLKNITA